MTRADSLSSDLAYLRDLAEAGENAPLLGGPFLAMWGGLVSLAYACHYIISQGMFGLDPAAYWIMWAGFGVIGGIGQYLLVKGQNEKPGQSSAGNRVQGVLWTTSGVFMSVYFIGVIVRFVSTGEGTEGFYWSVPMVLGLYGIGQFVTGAISGQTALKFAGIAAFAGVLAAVFLTGTEFIWLVGSASAFAAVCVPGLMMMRAEPAETV
jgi:hypothetical protein